MEPTQSELHQVVYRVERARDFRRQDGQESKASKSRTSGLGGRPRRQRRRSGFAVRLTGSCDKDYRYSSDARDETGYFPLTRSTPQGAREAKCAREVLGIHGLRGSK